MSVDEAREKVQDAIRSLEEAVWLETLDKLNKEGS